MVLRNNNDIWSYLDNATMWHIGINYMMILYDGFYMMMRCHKNTVILRSTTGFYERPVIEVAYGKTMIHSTEAVWEMLAWEEWLGVGMMHHPCLTYSDQHQCEFSIYIFFRFQEYKNLYVLYFQIYMYYKRTLVDSYVVLARWGSENVFNRPWVLKREIKPQTILSFILYVSFENNTLPLHYIY